MQAENGNLLLKKYLPNEFLVCFDVNIRLFLGINGILVSMILAYLYRTILLMIAANGKILKAGHITTIRRILRIFLTIFLVNSPFIFNLIIIDANNYINWILWGLGLVAASTLITILVNIVFDWEAFKGLFNRYVKRK